MGVYVVWHDVMRFKCCFVLWESEVVWGHDGFVSFFSGAKFMLSSPPILLYFQVLILNLQTNTLLYLNNFSTPASGQCSESTLAQHFFLSISLLSLSNTESALMALTFQAHRTTADVDTSLNVDGYRSVR